jgi:hypothetical protein
MSHDRMNGELAFLGMKEGDTYTSGVCRGGDTTRSQEMATSEAPTKGITAHGRPPPLNFNPSDTYRTASLHYIAAPVSSDVRTAQPDRQLHDCRVAYAVWAPFGALRGCT